MSEKNLGKVRGTTVYSGTAISGSADTDTIFSDSGVDYAYIGDLYVNTEAGADSSGYVYECTGAGDVSAATWIYVGSIRGAQGEKGDMPDSTEFDEWFANLKATFSDDAAGEALEAIEALDTRVTDLEEDLGGLSFTVDLDDGHVTLIYTYDE